MSFLWFKPSLNGDDIARHLQTALLSLLLIKTFYNLREVIIRLVKIMIYPVDLWFWVFAC